MDLEDSTPAVALPGAPVTQLTVFLENRVGALLSIVRFINDLDVEVVGLSVVDSVDATMVRMITTDPERVRTMFMEKGIACSETRVAVVQLDEGARGLAECLAGLLEGETNVHFSYPLLSRPQDKPALVLCLEDVDFGISVLTKTGFKNLYQKDLSR